MTPTVPFDEVLESAEQLSAEDQQALIEILHRRLAEAGRQRLATDVRESRQEFGADKCLPATPEAMIREILG